MRHGTAYGTVEDLRDSDLYQALRTGGASPGRAERITRAAAAASAHPLRPRLGALAPVRPSGGGEVRVIRLRDVLRPGRTVRLAVGPVGRPRVPTHPLDGG